MFYRSSVLIGNKSQFILFQEKAFVVDLEKKDRSLGLSVSVSKLLLYRSTESCFKALL